MAKATVQQVDQPYITAANDTAQVAIIGAAIGLLTYGLFWLIERFVVAPLLCSDGSAMCSTATAGNIAIVLSALVAMGVLIQRGVRRSALIAAATAVVAWGLFAVLQPLFWLESIAWAVGIFAVSFVTFYWLARIKNIIPALLATALVVVIVRIIINL